MFELLSRFHPGEIIGLVAVVGGLLVVITSVLGGIWREVRKTEIAAALKQDMLNRGMSADEIEAVLEAGTKRSRKELRRLHCRRD